MRRNCAEISSVRKQHKKLTTRTNVPVNVRQIRLELDYRSALYQTKQSDAAKAYLVGHDPG